MKDLEKQNKKLKAFGIVTGGLALVSAVVSAVVIRENNKVVNEYNDLVDKSNVLSDFINDHDFYVKQTNSKRPIKKQESKMNLQPVSSVDMGNGYIKKVAVDPKSGFSVCSYEKIKEDNVKEG